MNASVGPAVPAALAFAGPKPSRPQAPKACYQRKCTVAPMSPGVSNSN